MDASKIKACRHAEYAVRTLTIPRLIVERHSHAVGLASQAVLLVQNLHTPGPGQLPIARTAST